MPQGSVSHSTVRESRSSSGGGGGGGGRQVYITETRIERRRAGGPDVTGTASEGSLRSIMKSSTSSDKDSSSPAVMRRKICFVDNSELRRLVCSCCLLVLL